MPRSFTAPMSSTINDVDSDDAIGSAFAAVLSSSTTNQRRVAAVGLTAG